MDESSPDILVVDQKIDPTDLARLAAAFFEDMVKYVVDVEKGRAAVGGELHADAEQLLLQEGSLQSDLWGANYYPGKGREGLHRIHLTHQHPAGAGKPRYGNHGSCNP